MSFHCQLYYVVSDQCALCSFMKCVILFLYNCMSFSLLLLIWSSLVVTNLSPVCFIFFMYLNLWIYSFHEVYKKILPLFIQKFYFCLPLLVFMVHSRFVLILECLNLCFPMLCSLFLSAFQHPHVSDLMLNFYC